MRHAGGRNRDQPVSHLLLLPHPDADFSGTTLYDIIFLNLTLFLFSLLLSLFQAGYLKICLSTLRGEPISVGDMLYAFITTRTSTC